MLSIRLPKDIEEYLNLLAKNEETTKIEIVKNALTFYIDDLEAKKAQTPYDLGKEFFGKYSSENGNLSTTYKTKLKEKLNEKYHH